jgi:hypothetical protein
MTTLKTNAIEPEGATTNLTVGMTGQNVVVGGSGGIKANTFKDAGGNTLWTSNGSGVLSSVSGFGGDQVLLQTTTISSTTASINFTSGLTSTYKEYVFDFINMTLSDGGQNFFVNFSTDGGSNYNATKTTTSFWVNHDEDNSQGTRGAGPEYKTGFDKAQSAGDQLLNWGVSDDADSSLCGELHLFNPSSTTYVKHFYATTTCMAISDIGTSTNYTAGYLNTTSAVNAITFLFDAGDIESGTIKMYGIK